MNSCHFAQIICFISILSFCAVCHFALNDRIDAYNDVTYETNRNNEIFTVENASNLQRVDTCMLNKQILIKISIWKLLSEGGGHQTQHIEDANLMNRCFH